MQAPIHHPLKSQNLWLSADRAIFWEETKTLIASDLHFGKTGHFRKSGIAVPQSVYKEDLQRLVTLLHHFKPQRLLVVGDFFHSRANVELDWFKRWRDDFSTLQIQLVRGNHDILHDKWYQETSIEVIENILEESPFRFSHDKCDTVSEDYTFCGHIHPGIHLHGLGKQELRLPCYYFGRETCILPAFSKFTGTYTIQPAKDEEVFVIVDNTLLKM